MCIRDRTRGLPHKRLIAVILGLLLVAGFALMATLSLNVSAERWADIEGSMNARLRVYKICLDMIAVPESCVFGMGPGTFSTTFTYFATKADKSFTVFYHRAHQDYLQCLIEWGLVGFGMWMALLAYVLVAGIKKITNGSFYAAATLISIGSAMLQGLADFPAQIASLQWVGVMLCAVIVSPSQKVSEKSEAV